MSETDWKRVEALTDEEIEAAIADDPDAQFPDDPELWKKAMMKPPLSELAVIPVNPILIEKLNHHHVNYVVMVNKILEAVAAGYEDGK